MGLTFQLDDKAMLSGVIRYSEQNNLDLNRGFSHMMERAVREFVDTDNDRRHGRLLKSVCEHFGITENELKGHRKVRYYLTARQVYVYYARRYLEMSWKEIGESLGGRNHSSVMATYDTAMRKVGDKDKEFTEAYNRIVSLIQEVPA